VSLKVYLYAGLEGVAGVDSWTDCAPVPSRQASELLMGEVNAAADGAFAGGASGVVLVEGRPGSVIYRMADERMEVIRGRATDNWLPHLDAGFGAVFFVGAQAMSDTPGATLARTAPGGYRRWWLCGHEIGELGAVAAVAGAYGVPLVLASGDDKLCTEASQLIPEIETARVKTGIAAELARHLAMGKARENVRMAALRAAERAGRGEIPPFRPDGPPYTCRVWSGGPAAPAPGPGPDPRPISTDEVEYEASDTASLMRRVIGG
jgi:D-amino peptidase